MITLIINMKIIQIFINKNYINNKEDNQISNSEIKNININNNIEKKEEPKSEIKEKQESTKQNIPNNNLYHFNLKPNNNYIKNNFDYSYKPNKTYNNNIQKEIIINSSPCDLYYNTLHEEYLPKNNISQVNINNYSQRTYEIDSSKYDDNKNSLFSHSSIYNDLKRKNRYNYC